MKNTKSCVAALSGLLLVSTSISFAESPPFGGKRNLDANITQDDIKNRVFDLPTIQEMGLKVFTTPFNKYDGLGDGVTDNNTPSFEPGTRPTLQGNAGAGNGVMLRMNGLDSQSCLECHSIVDNRTIPAVLGIGGVGGLAATAFPGVSSFDPANNENNSYAAFNGRIINPPFVFGSGGVELLAKEMTATLRGIVEARRKSNNFGTKEDPIPLMANGVDFGTTYWRMPTNEEIKIFEKQVMDNKSNPDDNNCTALKNAPKPSGNFGLVKNVTAGPGTISGDTGTRAVGARSGVQPGSTGTPENSLMMFIAPRHSAYSNIVSTMGAAKSNKSVMRGLRESNPGKSAVEMDEMLSNNAAFSGLGLVLDLENVRGVGADLVVKPFGRKGNNVTTRDFDCGAIRFHQGIEPVEIVGENVDNDNDGVINEVTVGQMSALAIFNTTTPPACQAPNYSTVGEAKFVDAGCSGCHVPVLETKGTMLTYSQPELSTKPSANQYYDVDLSAANVLRFPNTDIFAEGFKTNGAGGISVPLFSDLKIHDMGPRLQESLVGDGVTAADNRAFITARLWGVADTAPYMHDGRALTITEAIDWHGGEAAQARQKFFGMPEADRNAILAYLGSLHTPGSKACEMPAQ